MQYHLFVFLFVVVVYCTEPIRTPITITADLVNVSNWQNTFIVGGDPVPSATAYPFMAGYLDNGYHFCGASIISNEWLLTAAHCVGPRFPDYDEVSVGSLRHDGGGNPQARWFKVYEAIRHPSFSSSNLDFDVALLRLATPIPGWSTTVQPIRFVSTDAGSYDGWPATVTGWGLTSDGGSPSNVLLEVTYPIITNARCSQMYNGITPRMLCAYEPGKDSCSGDSGGPFFVSEGDDWVQVGIVSWGVGCAGVGAPGVYARISAVSYWICEVSGVCY